MLPRIRKVFGFVSPPNRHERGRQRFRPQVEALEERLTPTTYTPTTLTDFAIGSAANVNSSNGQILAGAGTGQVTLRSAVIAANAHGGADIITFNAAVGTTYTLTIPPLLSGGDKVTHDATTGSLDVTGALTITGNGSASTIIQAGTSSSNGIDQLFNINPLIGGSPAAGFAVSITGLTLQNGKNASNDQNADGEGGAIAFDAGIDNAGSLTLSNDVITQNQTINGDGGGVALFDGGTVSITNCTISNNTAHSTGTNAVLGGGMFVGFSPSVGTLTITTSQITGNKVVAPSAAATSTGGGIDDSFEGLALTIHGGQISSNQAPGDGGGINAGSVTIDQSTLIDSNTAGGKGGGVFGNAISITNATITNNGAATGGGGVYVNSGTTSTITGSRFFNNSSTSGAKGVDRNASNSATVTANGNWWGTNNGPSAFIAASGVTAANWLGLVLTPGSDTIATNSSTALNSKFVSTTTSTPPSGGAPVTGTALEGLNVTFAAGAIAGTSVSPTSVAVSSGAASSTFFSGSTTGTAHPSVALDNQTTTTTVTIGVALQSIAVTPANPNVPKGQTQQFTATGTYSDNSTQNLTSQVTWGSATTSVATITTTGLATAVATGTSTISATLGAISGSTVMTVTQPVSSVSTVSVSWGTRTSGTLVDASGGRLLSTGRSTDLPWLNINKINITLSTAATLSPADVSVTGITDDNYGPVTISGSGTTSITITLARAISAADRVTVTIGNAGITTYTRRLDVLPGDFQDRGVVDSANMLAVYYATAQPYNIFADINGDGVVDVNDVNATRSRIGTRLP